MRLSRQCEIAIDILVFCAQRPNRLVRTRDAAASANTTKLHAHQVAAQLTRAGLLEGVRGQRGGIRLSRRASHIVVGEVVRLMERSFDDVETDVQTGAFSILTRQAAQAALDAFDAFTIADIAGQRPRLRNVLGINQECRGQCYAFRQGRADAAASCALVPAAS